MAYPEGEASPFSQCDGDCQEFEFDQFANDLELSKAQSKLLWYKLNSIKVHVRFDSFPRGENAPPKHTLALATSCENLVVSDIDLFDLINWDRFQIGDEEEIEVLKRLRAGIDEQIAFREGFLSEEKQDH